MAVLADRDAGLQGHYAGIATRMAAFAVDVVAVVLIFALAGQALDYVVSTIFGSDFRLRDSTVLSDVLLALWAFAYFAYPLSIGGRTPGMGLVGLEVVRSDGRALDNRHAILRVLALLLSIVFFWLAVILVLVRRDRRTIHDLIGDTAVVYSWDARGARLRVLARRDHVEPV
jgi:uncharacterized RDD family membrane protein YckC